MVGNKEEKNKSLMVALVVHLNGIISGTPDTIRTCDLFLRRDRCVDLQCHK